MNLYRRIFESIPDALLVIDEDGRIALLNAQAGRLFGYGVEELTGESIEILIPERYADHHADFRAAYGTEPRLRTMGARLELSGRRKDGSEFPVDIMLGPMRDGEASSTLCVVRDVTDRQQTEQLLASLREKEVLLKEVHHRVKNNLAVISSLFYLQSTYTSDEPTIRILHESQERVRSMALVHETLYRSENLAAVDFAEYARDLSRRLVRAYRPHGREIRLATELESVSMGIDLAVPCGLILNELITNALTHAFGDGDGDLRVALRHTGDGRCELRVEDTGVGLPPDLDVERSTSLGLRLIRSLIRQIDGRFELRSMSPGTEALISLRIER